MKLLNWFNIETSLGNYNPDWVAVIEIKGEENKSFLRLEQQAKINCQSKHFEAIDTGVTYEVLVAYADDFLNRNTLNDLL